MKKILFLALDLLVAVTSFGQGSLVADSTQRIEGDSVNIRNAEFSSSKLEDATRSEGDSAYIRSDFASAARIYESLLHKGDTADVYYNLGNSCYKVSEITKTILSYERALLPQPGNGDIRTNLGIAHGKTVDRVEAVSEVFFVTWTKALINSMNIDTWAVWGAVSFLLLIVSLYLFVFSRQVVLKKVEFITSIVFLIIIVMTNVFASKQKEELLHRDNVVIVNPNVTVRSTPSEGGISLSVPHEGHKVDIKDNSTRDWKETHLEDGRVGRIPVNSIEIIRE